MSNPERDGRQARRMRDRGWFNEDQLRKALTWPRAPGDDLVAVLLGRGLLTPESAEIIRRETESGAVLPTRPPSTRVDPNTPYGRAAGVPPTRVDSGSHALTRSSRTSLPTRLGPWDLEKEIARGGMGSVHLARHAETGQVAALKLIHSGLSDDAAERFRIEARAAGRLSHPGIVGILDSGEQDGTAYLVMEYVDGEALDQRIARTGPLPADEAARLGVAMAEALDAAHGADVLHRDLKPANVLLTTDGAPRLTDFGLAKLEDGDGEGLTRTGEMIGTPQYMPPEQLQGEKHRIDRRADVYSLGATLYEMLAGRPPFMADSMMDTVVQVTMQAPEPPSRWEPEVPRELDAICLRCLSKAPDDRYRTAGELARDLDRFLAGDAIEAKLTRRGGARRIPAVLALFLLVAGGLGFAAWQRARPGAIELRTAGLTFDAEILSAPPGSAATGETVWRGAVPARVDLPPGRYELRVRDRRLHPRPSKGDVFHVNPGESAELELEVIRRTGRVKVISASKDKGLRLTASHVDDAALRRRSPLPAELELPVGRWTLLVAGPGTLNETREIEIREDEEVRLELRPLQRELWRVKVNDGAIGNPVFYDPDRCGREDIFVTAGQALGRITRTGVRTWLVNNELINRELSVGDLLGDGRPGIVTRSIAGKPVCFRVEESQIERLQGLSVTATAGPRPLKLDDVPGDDYLFVSERRELVAYGPASRTSIFRRSFGDAVELPVPLVDPAGPLKGDSEGAAVLCTTSGSSVLGLRRDGTDAWVRTVEGPLGHPVVIHGSDGEVALVAIASAAASPSIQTFKPDGTPAWKLTLEAKARGILEIQPKVGVRALAVLIEGGKLRFIDLDGRPLGERPGEPSDGVVGHWAKADFNGDGRESLVLGGNRAGVGQISALDSDGALIWRHRASAPLSSLNHADLNGDGFPELLVGCENGELFALTASRTPLQWRVATPAPPIGPTIAFEAGLLGPGGEWISTGAESEASKGLAGEVLFAPRTSPFYPAFDAARGELLIPDIEGLSAWKPKEKVARSLIKRSGISSATVIGDRLILCDVGGSVAIHDLKDDARLLHKLQVRGRVTAPAVPFVDEQGKPDRAFLLTSTGWHTVIDLQRGKIIGIMKDAGSVRWPALILDPGDTKRPCRFAVLRSDSWVEFYEALGDTLKRVAKVRLDRVACGPMTLLRKDGKAWRIVVPMFEGWLDFIDVSGPAPDLAAVMREDQCLPYGSIAAIDIDRDGTDEAVCGWLQPIRDGPKGFVTVNSGEGFELFRFGASTRCAHVIGAPDGSVLVFDSRVSRYGPWPKVVAAPRRNSDWQVVQLIASGAANAAKARLDGVKDPFLRKCLFAMSETILGRKESLVKIVQNKEEQPRFEKLFQSWQNRGKTMWSDEQLMRIIGPFKKPVKKGIELRALVKKAQAAPVVHVDFRKDPLVVKGAAVSVTKAVGFRPDREITGLFVNVNGHLHFRFVVAEESKRRIRLLHRALPNFGVGSSTLKISVDDKVIVKCLETPWWGPYEEKVPLGKLAKGVHDLKFEVIDAGTVWSVLEVTIERMP